MCEIVCEGKKAFVCVCGIPMGEEFPVLVTQVRKVISSSYSGENRHSTHTSRTTIRLTDSHTHTHTHMTLKECSWVQNNFSICGIENNGLFVLWTICLFVLFT